MEPGKVRIVLHRPQSADNIGAVARAMKNFGLSRLAIVAPPSWAGPPRSGGPGTAREDVLARARRLARRASDLLEVAEIHADLRGALGPAVWTCGTTSRAVEGRPRLDPGELAGEVALRTRTARSRSCSGRSGAALRRGARLCQAVCSIPTSPAYDSMNSPSRWRCSRTRSAGRVFRARRCPPRRSPPGTPRWRRCGTGSRALLDAAGYLNPQNPEHILADLRRLLARAEPTQREVELVLAAVRALERKLRERER